MTGTGKYVLLAFCIGGLLPVQAGINALLAGAAGHPLLAAAINFLVGGLCIFTVLVLMQIQLPAPGIVRSVPWYYWLGGALGISMVVTAIIAAPKLGASTMIALFIAGQMTVSLLLDHKGWLGYPEHGISVFRVVGALLIIAGVVMIRRF